MYTSSIRQTSVKNKITFLQTDLTPNVNHRFCLCSKRSYWKIQSRNFTIEAFTERQRQYPENSCRNHTATLQYFAHVLPAPRGLWCSEKPANSCSRVCKGSYRACARKPMLTPQRIASTDCGGSYGDFPPGQKAVPVPSLPVCLHNRSRKHARQLPAVHGKGIQQRHIICLHFNSLGKKNQQLASSLGVWHSVRHKKKNKIQTQEKIRVWVFWEGERVFVLKWVILYVRLGRKENVWKHETQDQSPVHHKLLNELVQNGKHLWSYFYTAWVIHPALDDSRSEQDKFIVFYQLPPPKQKDIQVVKKWQHCFA